MNELEFTNNKVLLSHFESPTSSIALVIHVYLCKKTVQFIAYTG